MINNILSIMFLSTIFISCTTKMPLYNVTELDSDQVNKETYDEGGKFFYKISKDNEYLYVNIHSNFTPTQMKILKNGIKLCFDESGKKSTDNFIQYPIKSNMQIKPEERSYGVEKNAMMQLKIASLSDEILLVDDDKEFLNRSLNTYNISSGIYMADEDLIYKIKIPLSIIKSENSEQGSMGIIIDGVSRPSSANTNRGQRPSGAGGSPGGGGRPSGAGGGKPPGGGRPSGVGGGRPTETAGFSDLNKDINIWFKLDI